MYQTYTSYTVDVQINVSLYFRPLCTFRYLHTSLPPCLPLSRSQEQPPMDPADPVSAILVPSELGTWSVLNHWILPDISDTPEKHTKNKEAGHEVILNQHSRYIILPWPEMISIFTKQQVHVLHCSSLVCNCFPLTLCNFQTNHAMQSKQHIIAKPMNLCKFWGRQQIRHHLQQQQSTITRLD